MATIYDLIEVTGFSENTTYSAAAGNLLDVVDGASSADLNDGEFDQGDDIVINGVSYTISQIQEPASSGRFTLADGSNRSIDPGSESNLSAIFLTVTNGSETRYFIIPNDSYGDMNIDEIRTGSLTNVAGSDAGVISTTNNAVNIVCFVAGSMIETPNGAVAVENIRCGDLVLTRDNGAQIVKAIPMKQLNLHCAPDRLRPIAFEAGSLGQNRPNQRLCLSPHHRVLVTDPLGNPVLVPAKALIGRHGVRIMRGKQQVSYYHLVFSRHEIIWANGMPTESFFPGQMALRAVSRETLEQVRSIYGITPLRAEISAQSAAAHLLKVQPARRAALILTNPA
jgi:Hint domain